LAVLLHGFLSFVPATKLITLLIIVVLLCVLFVSVSVVISLVDRQLAGSLHIMAFVNACSTIVCGLAEHSHCSLLARLIINEEVLPFLQVAVEIGFFELALRRPQELFQSLLANKLVQTSVELPIEVNLSVLIDLIELYLLAYAAALLRRTYLLSVALISILDPLCYFLLYFSLQLSTLMCHFDVLLYQLLILELGLLDLAGLSSDQAYLILPVFERGTHRIRPLHVLEHFLGAFLLEKLLVSIFLLVQVTF